MLTSPGACFVPHWRQTIREVPDRNSPASCQVKALWLQIAQASPSCSAPSRITISGAMIGCFIIHLTFDFSFDTSRLRRLLFPFQPDCFSERWHRQAISLHVCSTRTAIAGAATKQEGQRHVMRRAFVIGSLRFVCFS